MILSRLYVYLQDLRRRLEINQAVFFGLLAKIWNLCTGPVTALLIVAKFSPEVQGYYYTFGTILALQVFVEMGLGVVVQQFASHEWSHLNLDKEGRIVGAGDALSRLVSIANVAFKWYAVGAIAITLGLSVGGYIFFASSPQVYVAWSAPWFFLALLTGINVLLVPVWSFLEGCNQVTNLYTYRFVQGMITSICVWVAILLGAELWAATVLSVVTLLCALVFLKRKYFIFFKTLLFTRPSGPRISWRAHMLPMQWRIALSWISGYFVFSLFTPVLFKFSGPVVAGQFGMTWAVVGLVGTISGSWLSPRVPQLAMLIAQKKYNELDCLFWKLMKIVISVNIIIALLIWLSIYFLNTLNHPVATRFAFRLLAPLPTGLLLAAQVLIYSAVPFSLYMRAHKEEPIMYLAVLAAIMIGLSTVILGKYYSATGMAFGYLVVNMIIMPFVFLIWHRRRIQWHKDSNIIERNI
jgi:O-antigen/teichoic acid export membrane protein